MPYIIVFFLSSSLMYFSNSRILNNKYKNSHIWFVILSILIVSIFAGVRNDTIGTDMKVYGNYVFLDSIKYSDFYSYYTSTVGWFKVEPFYMFINFIASRISTSPVFFYFFLSVLINTLMYMSIINFNIKNHINVAMSWISYLLIYYGYTFNLLRQSLAIAFLFIGFSYLYNEKYKISSVFIVIASLTHYSSLVASLLIIFSYFLLKFVKNKKLVIYSIIILSTISFIAINPILKMLITSNLLSEKYLMYINNSGGLGFSWKSIILKVPVIFVFIYAYRYSNINDSKNNDDYFFFLFIFILDFIIYQLRMINVTFSRMSLYLQIYQVISIPFLISIMESFKIFGFELPLSKKNVTFKIHKNSIACIYVFYLIAVWYYQIVLVGINEIYPYVSDILRIK
ncbi:EpsG family protein [Enterococcus aquimarinus]|uniref:EpsG family protein n=1 Tax=Enterococcus aquimarinus TaxID=328396 RepID=A0A1L8QQC0_9ENTE|nr:EpsG family protein [Enterococcus aquimarinus]OJG09657.1 hypothetical protein RU93_GL000640 [Enterococcus aquimarinus]